MNQALVATKFSARSTRTPISAVVTRGEANEIVFVFHPGSAVPPFSVGTQGDWRVVAQGVEARHLYLCFDGRALFAAVPAGDANARALLDGKQLDALWTRLPEPCELVFGGASIALSNPTRDSEPPSERTSQASSSCKLDARGPRVADPFGREPLLEPLISPLAARNPFDTPTLPRPVNLADTVGVPGATTNLQATLAVGDNVPSSAKRPARAAFASYAATRVAEPSSVSALANTIVRPVTSPPGMATAATLVSAPAGATPASTAPDRVAKPSAVATQGKPLIRKLMAGLIVAALVLTVARAFRTHLASPATQIAVEPSAAAMHAAPVVSAATEPAAAVQRVQQPKIQAESAAQLDGKTRQRQAVDCVARGAYAEAAALYERLAQDGDEPSFREAARIARRKARGR